MWASLRFVEQQPANKKRIVRLLREPQLLVQPNLQLKAKPTAAGRQPRPTQPNEWWGIAMTKVLVEGFGWIDIVVVLDWYTTMILGYSAGMQCQSQRWLAALEMAGTRQFRAGVHGQGLALLSDKGYQPTSTAFMRACRILESQHAFTSDNNLKGNADTEWVVRTLKEECLWLQEWICSFAWMTALERRIAILATGLSSPSFDNWGALHSAEPMP